MDSLAGQLISPRTLPHAPLTGSSPAWHMLLLSHNLAYSRAMCFYAFVFLPAVAAATPVAVVVVDAVVTVSLPLCDNSHNERDLGLSYFLVYFLSFQSFFVSYFCG